MTVLGSTTCEDTAIVASRLRALGVPFLEVDIDADAAAARRVASLNGGRVVAVRRPDIPGGAPLAAILRYAV
jgi:hypothetical protein